MYYIHLHKLYNSQKYNVVCLLRGCEDEVKKNILGLKEGRLLQVHAMAEIKPCKMILYDKQEAWTSSPGWQSFLSGLDNISQDG